MAIENTSLDFINHDPDERVKRLPCRLFARRRVSRLFMLSRHRTEIAIAGGGDRGRGRALELLAALVL
ncbi:hypothetical protein [Sorangium cellulosum]|uniref:hypothetical protein n=1 Tax=Sorangium cellulosum TaxID=56 RepID=UPI0011DD4CA6|nr:hypothetical protein [Sorangium cellulosum]